MNVSLSKDVELARLQSVQADGSHRWLTVTSRKRSLRLTDQEYRTCVKYRLGVHIAGIQDLDQHKFTCHAYTAY
jgi:hypothetical protein